MKSSQMVAVREPSYTNTTYGDYKSPCRAVKVKNALNPPGVDTKWAAEPLLGAA